MLLLTILCILLTWWIGRCLQLISIGRFFRAAFRRISCETSLLELDVFDDLYRMYCPFKFRLQHSSLESLKFLWKALCVHVSAFSFLFFFFFFLFLFFLVHYIRNFVVTRNFGHPRTIFTDSLHRQRDWKQRSVNETLETFSIAQNGPKSVRIKVSSPRSHDWRRQRNKILDIATRDTYVRTRVFFFQTRDFHSKMLSYRRWTFRDTRSKNRHRFLEIGVDSRKLITLEYLMRSF